jgi:hypothetical protein
VSVFSESVTLHLPGQPTGELDRYNRPLVGDPQEIPATGWWEPRGNSGGSSSEDTVQAEQYVTGYWLYVQAPECDLIRGDTQVSLTIAGQLTRFEVIGEPGHHPQGVLLGRYVWVALQRVTG